MAFFGFKLVKNSKKPNEERAFDVNADLHGRTFDGVSFLNTGDGVGTIKVTESTALKLSAVWACVKIKSNQLATLPSNFYIRDSKGDSQVAATIAAQRLIKQPNAYMTPFDFKFAMMSAKMLHGNGYARIVRDGNAIPTELIPLHPNRVEVLMDEGELIYKIDNHYPEKPENMLHFKGFTLDGLLGLSVIKTEAQNLGLALASQNELKNFYEKGSKIPGFVSYPNKLQDISKSKSEEALQNKIAGTSPTTQVPIFDNGAKYVPVGVNPAEALWLEMMGYGVEEICRIFGVPPHLVASLKQSTNNNIEHQGMDFVNHGLLPEAKCFEEEIERKLLSPSEKSNHYFKFNMNGLLRGDSQARAELYRALFSTAAISPNEIRRLEELNGYEDGDKYYLQLNLMDVTTMEDYYLKQSTTAKRSDEDELEDLIRKTAKKDFKNG